MANMIKKPAQNGNFQLISIFFTQKFLRKYAVDNRIINEQKYSGKENHYLGEDPFMTSYFNLLKAYLDNPARNVEKLAELKIREALELLLQLNPEFAYLPFDFDNPHKIDLQKFMYENYSFNAPVHTFARLTGRSVASFKRDFQKIFVTSPRK